MNLPVVVTGASGFLGSHLIAALRKKGLNVIAVSRRDGFDVCKPETLEQLPQFSALFHLAADTFVPDSYNKTAQFFSTNINGTLNCLELCKKNKAQFLFAGSYVYGQPQYLPVDEKHPLSLWNPYATSKIIGEQLCQSYSKEFGISSTSLRIFNIYGKGQNPNMLIPKIINGLQQGKLELETSTPKRDFVFMDDVINAFMLANEKKLQGFNAFNVGFGKSYSVAEVVDVAKNILNSHIEVKYNNTLRPTEVPDVIASFSKIKTELGWEPKVDLEEGIGRIV